MFHHRVTQWCLCGLYDVIDPFSTRVENMISFGVEDFSADD